MEFDPSQPLIEFEGSETLFKVPLFDLVVRSVQVEFVSELSAEFPEPLIFEVSKQRTVFGEITIPPEDELLELEDELLDEEELLLDELEDEELPELDDEDELELLEELEEEDELVVQRLL